jgi:hypothetical protein
MISLKIGGIIVAAFIAGAFVASPELRAYAANTIGSSDIIDESILSQDIKNGEVKTADISNSAVTTLKIATDAVDGTKIKDNSITSADIGTDAVRASELQGVTKLIFAEAPITFDMTGGISTSYAFHVDGIAVGDQVLATWNQDGVNHFINNNVRVTTVNVVADSQCTSEGVSAPCVEIGLVNDSPSTQMTNGDWISLIIFHQ